MSRSGPRNREDPRRDAAEDQVRFDVIVERTHVVHRQIGVELPHGFADVARERRLGPGPRPQMDVRNRRRPIPQREINRRGRRLAERAVQRVARDADDGEGAAAQTEAPADGLPSVEEARGKGGIDDRFPGRPWSVERLEVAAGAQRNLHQSEISRRHDVRYRLVVAAVGAAVPFHGEDAHRHAMNVEGHRGGECRRGDGRARTQAIEQPRGKSLGVGVLHPQAGQVVLREQHATAAEAGIISPRLHEIADEDARGQQDDGRQRDLDHNQRGAQAALRRGAGAGAQYALTLAPREMQRRRQSAYERARYTEQDGEGQAKTVEPGLETDRRAAHAQRRQGGERARPPGGQRGAHRGAERRRARGSRPAAGGQSARGSRRVRAGPPPRGGGRWRERAADSRCCRRPPAAAVP